MTMIIEQAPLTLHLHPVVQLTPEQFFEFCQLNADLPIERTAEGDLIIMAPAGGESSFRNSKLVRQLDTWADQDGTRVVFDSSGGFDLPDGSTKSPDAAWVRRSKLAALTPHQKQRFLPLCPDFVIELRSPSDKLNKLQAKMEEYIANGTALGWLIDPVQKQVYIYRPNQAPTFLDHPMTLSGEAVLPGFTLDLSKIWTVGF